MKSSTKIIILIILLSLLISCTALYDKLSQEYAPDNIETFPKTSSTTLGNTSSTINSNTSSTPGDTDSQDPPADDIVSQFSAPDFTVLDSEGNQIKLSSFAGKPIVLNFWGTWCGYCKMEMPDFQAIHEKYPDVQFVMVNYGDSISSAKNYVQENGFTFPIFFDTTEDAVQTYAVTGFPTSFFINANGELVAQARGMISAAQLENAIKMITE